MNRDPAVRMAEAIRELDDLARDLQLSHGATSALVIWTQDAMVLVQRALAKLEKDRQRAARRTA